MNSPVPSSTLINSLPESWVERLFDRMLLSFGKKFTDQWGGTDAQKLFDFWAVELAGYSGEELKRGLKSMEDQDWPPSLPQFKKMCRPPVDTVHAYYEAISGLQARAKGEIGTWSHPAIYWAATGMTFDLLNQTFSMVKQRWEKALGDQMEKGAWEPVPPAFIALAAPGKEWTKKAAGETLKAIGAADLLQPKTDHKRWAKVIMKRHEEGDKSLTPLQVRFAREALNKEAA